MNIAGELIASYLHDRFDSKDRPGADLRKPAKNTISLHPPPPLRHKFLRLLL